LAIIAEALVRRGDFDSAIETAHNIKQMDIWAKVIGSILAVQEKVQGAEAARESMAKVEDESLRNQARAAMEEINGYKVEPIDLLSIWRLSVYVNDTFDTLFPRESPGDLMSN